MRCFLPLILGDHESDLLAQLCPIINFKPLPSPAISNELHGLKTSSRAKASAGSMNGCGSVVNDTCWYSGSRYNQHDAPFRVP